MESTKLEMATPESSTATENLAPLEMSEQPDHELLELFQRSQDSSAFELLVERHHPMIFGVAKRMLGCPHSAQDVVQATFLVLARDARKIRKRHSIVSWLYGVAYRISARTARRQSKSTVLAMEDKVMVTADPLEKLAAQYEQNIVFEELHRLPESLKGPLVQRYLKGRSNSQIASEMGMSESAVEGRLKRGRKQLRLHLARKGVTYGIGIGILNLVQRESFGCVMPTIDSATLTASVLVEAVTDNAGAASISQEVVHMSEEELFKMATLKMLTITVVATIAVGMAASGWALAGNLSSSNQDVESGSPFVRNSNDVEESNANDLPGANVTLANQESTPDTVTEPIFAGGNSLPTETANPGREERLRSVGHYSVEALPENELKIMEALQKPVRFDYFEQRLGDVVAEIKSDYDVQVHLDSKALAAVGSAGEEELITLNLNNVSLSNGLELMLDKIDLTTIISNEILIITSKEKADRTLRTRIYPLNSDWMISEEDLMECIVEGIAQDTWKGNGGNGSMSIVDGGLVISCRPQIHDEINKLLAQFDKLYLMK